MSRYTPAITDRISQVVKVRAERDRAHACRDMETVCLADADLLVLNTELDTLGYDFPAGR